MSITAEKIEQIARVIDPYAFDESGMTVDLAADAEWQTQGQRRDNARDTARAVLALLQQGEPVGWREAKRIADLWFEPWGAAKAIEWEFSGDVPFTPENALRKIQRLLSASPLKDTNQ
ncbi:MAG: hypothetical protein KIT15_16900 [Xanthobacteraceae bacterium]|nr:hypothetical protein [Xanthobacteraceae bacterium]